MVSVSSCNSACTAELFAEHTRDEFSLAHLVVRASIDVQTSALCIRVLSVRAASNSGLLCTTGLGMRSALRNHATAATQQ